MLVYTLGVFYVLMRDSILAVFFLKLVPGGSLRGVMKLFSPFGLLCVLELVRTELRIKSYFPISSPCNVSLIRIASIDSFLSFLPSILSRRERGMKLLVVR